MHDQPRSPPSESCVLGLEYVVSHDDAPVACGNQSPPLDSGLTVFNWGNPNACSLEEFSDRSQRGAA